MDAPGRDARLLRVHRDLDTATGQGLHDVGGQPAERRAHVAHLALQLRRHLQQLPRLQRKLSGTQQVALTSTTPGSERTRSTPPRTSWATRSEL